MFLNPRVELRIPVASSVETALFLDAGNLWTDPARVMRSNSDTPLVPAYVSHADRAASVRLRFQRRPRARRSVPKSRQQALLGGHRCLPFQHRLVLVIFVASVLCTPVKRCRDFDTLALWLCGMSRSDQLVHGERFEASGNGDPRCRDLSTKGRCSPGPSDFYHPADRASRCPARRRAARWRRRCGRSRSAIWTWCSSRSSTCRPGCRSRSKL